MLDLPDIAVEINAAIAGQFGASQFATAVAAGEPAPETVRQLMRHVLTHQADQLQDDASIVVLEWRTGDEAQLLP